MENNRTISVFNRKFSTKSNLLERVKNALKVMRKGACYSVRWAEGQALCSHTGRGGENRRLNGEEHLAAMELVNHSSSLYQRCIELEAENELLYKALLDVGSVRDKFITKAMHLDRLTSEVSQFVTQIMGIKENNSPYFYWTVYVEHPPGQKNRKYYCGSYQIKISGSGDWKHPTTGKVTHFTWPDALTEWRAFENARDEFYASWEK
jgi:hypothetical protein